MEELNNSIKKLMALMVEMDYQIHEIWLASVAFESKINDHIKVVENINERVKKLED